MIAVVMLCKQSAMEAAPYYIQRFAFVECFMVKDAHRTAQRHWREMLDGEYADFVVLAYDLDEGMAHLRHGDAYMCHYDPTCPKQ